MPSWRNKNLIHRIGSQDATKPWTTDQRLKIAKLPIKCKIRFIPRQRYNPNALLPKSINNTYVDKFKKEWDFQLSKLGTKSLGWASRDGKHLNVSLNKVN